MKTKQARLAWALFGVALAAIWALGCGGDKADSRDFGPKNSKLTKSQNYCKDGIDNDGDATADYYGVPPHCMDRGVDTCIFPPDPKCQIAGSMGEAACSDNLDNDGDTLVDQADPDCYYRGTYLPQLDLGELPVIWITSINTGPNGICESKAMGDDKQVMPVGTGVPLTFCVSDANGDFTVGIPGGDDKVFPNSCVNGTNCTAITTGADGICGSIALAGDTQLIPLGQGEPDQPCISAGDNGVINTTPGGDDLFAP
jgi:hypothetical protein